MLKRQFGLTQRYNSSVLEQTSLVSGSTPFIQGCTLVYLKVIINSNNNTRYTTYVQIHDGCSVPNLGAVPLLVFPPILALPINIGQNIEFGIPEIPLLTVNNGIVIVSSTTLTTYTPGVEDMWVTCFWVTGKLLG